MKKRSLIALVLVLVLAVTLLTGCFSSRSRYNYSSSGSGYSSSHDCYVCGKSASKKYGSHYYCTTHYAMVKTVVEAG
jgi:hypothetical protein